MKSFGLNKTKRSEPLPPATDLGSLQLPQFNEQENPDLGFGTVVARESRARLLNRDGSVNVERRGMSFWSSVSPYQTLLTMSWRKFLALMALSYLLVNLCFAAIYQLSPGSLQGGNIGIESSFAQAFFFSVHTFGTIGYGNVSPVGWFANLVVTIEALVSLLSVALATGILFARFSRPTARIVFSNQAIIAPYQDRTGFMFRIANARHNELIEVACSLIYSQFENVNGAPIRKFYKLELERSQVTFFTLSWTVVHPIDETSPLHGLTEQDLHEREAEFLILLSGIDETFSQVVHTRSSYKPAEMIWNARFVNIYNKPAADGRVTIDVKRIHEIERLNAG